jgi:hypothetical protein
MIARGLWKLAFALSLFPCGRSNAAEVVISGDAVRREDRVCMLSKPGPPWTSTAAKDGSATIVNATTLKGYSRVVISDHPERYITSYCGDLELGSKGRDDVSQCPPMGTSVRIVVRGRLTEYFTIRVDPNSKFKFLVSDAELGLFTEDCSNGSKSIDLAVLGGRALFYVPKAGGRTAFKVSVAPNYEEIFQLDALRASKDLQVVPISLRNGSKNAQRFQGERPELLVTYVQP